MISEKKIIDSQIRAQLELEEKISTIQAKLTEFQDQVKVEELSPKKKRPRRSSLFLETQVRN